MSAAFKLPQWRALQEHYKRVQADPLAARFRADPERFERLSFEAAGLFLDLSKNHLDPAMLEAMLDWAVAAGLPERISDLYAGRHVNVSEDRPALHMALRGRVGDRYLADGENVVPAVLHERERLLSFADRLRTGQWQGFDGRPITHLVHIGIGGSDLGPRMVCSALADGGPVQVRFVANVDGADLARAVRDLNPATTAFSVASKSWTTLETKRNAEAAREWLCAGAVDHETAGRQILALTANPEAAAAFGIPNEHVLPLWPWVGGRYSVWSVVGFPIAVAAGSAGFEAFLRGARAVDLHFRDAPLAANLPVLLALTGIVYRNLARRPSLAVLPYATALGDLPRYLQQLEMESNGKSVGLTGEPLSEPACPVIWGDVGTNCQHAFFQLLHQGRDWIPVDFVIAKEPTGPDRDAHRELLANALAQSEALMVGRDSASDPHRVCPGNRPSSVIALTALDAESLGALLALYEHKVFVQGALWGVNSFDQFGVELGKKLAAPIASELAAGNSAGDHDGSTLGLMRRLIS